MLSTVFFHDNPLTPWKSLHEEAETRSRWPNRIVGWKVSDTKKYIKDMNKWPGLGGDRNSRPGPGGRMNTMPQEFDNSNYCRDNYDDCFLEDEFRIPKDAPLGPAVMRWIHYSLETPQVFAECVDLEIVAGVPGGTCNDHEDSSSDGNATEDSSGDAPGVKNNADSTIILLSMGAQTVISVWSMLPMLSSIILLLSY